MGEAYYCQYAYLPAVPLPAGIGQGIDPQFPLELVVDEPMAALVSRVGQQWLNTVKGQHGKDREQLKMLSTRCDEITRLAAVGQAVFPLRPRVLLRSAEAVQAAMARFKPIVMDFFRVVGKRREWLVELYW